MELKWKLLVSLAAQTERDRRIAQLTASEELALIAKRAGQELRDHADRALMRTSIVGQSDPVDMQAKLEELPLSRDQQFGQYGKKLANVRAKFEAKDFELEAIRLRLADTKKGWTKSKGEADTLHAQVQRVW